MASALGCVTRHFKELLKTKCISYNVYRFTKTDAHKFFTLDPNAEISNPKHHPGIMKFKNRKFPPRLREAMDKLLEKYPIPKCEKKVEAFCHSLKTRRVPLEVDEIHDIVKRAEKHILEEDGQDLSEIDAEEEEIYFSTVKNKIKDRIKRHALQHKPIEYDAYNSFLYLFGRMASDFAVLHQIFHEIKLRAPDYNPQTVLDFGSGVGSSVWAVNEIWSKPPAEHICIDSSSNMNTVARLLLQDGEEAGDISPAGVYFRKAMFVSRPHQYSLVVSAFTLLDLADRAERLQTCLSLWRKTRDFLVIAELANNAGFKVLSEARHFLLQCPHDLSCPRLQSKDKVCGFLINYENYKKMNKKANYSYIILRKGKRDINAPVWPRVVAPNVVSKRLRQVMTCGSDGSLHHTHVSAKHRSLFQCTKACSWGDLLPVKEKYNEPSQEGSTNSDDSSEDNIEDNTFLSSQNQS